MSDMHVRRTGEDYAQAFAALLPRGVAWPRGTDSVAMKAVGGLSQIWGYVDGRIADLLETESDPRKTIDLLSDWERNWGLPDECFPQPHTIEERRNVLLLKMTLLGAQSREFFISAAHILGYTITITEYSPFMVGISSVGDTRDPSGENPDEYRWQIGAPEIRFYWTVHVGLASLIWFRASQSQAGVDHHLKIGLAIDLECLLNRWKPAHTQIVFDYSGLAFNGSMAGTP